MWEKINIPNVLINNAVEKIVGYQLTSVLSSTKELLYWTIICLSFGQWNYLAPHWRVTSSNLPKEKVCGLCTFLFWLILHCTTFLKKRFVWKAERRGRGGSGPGCGQRHLSSTCWLTSQISAIARGKPGWKQEPGTPFRPQNMGARLKWLVQSSVAFPGTLAGSCNRSTVD